MEKIINLTPHDINVYHEGVLVRTIPSGGIARCSAPEEAHTQIAGVPTIQIEKNQITGLPDPVPGVYYVVSSLVAQSAKKSGRTDLLVPSRLIKEGDTIVGCQCFSQM